MRYTEISEGISYNHSTYWYNSKTGEVIPCGDHGDAVQDHTEKFGVDYGTVSEMEDAWPHGSDGDEEHDFETQDEYDDWSANLPDPPAECGPRLGNDRNNCWEQLGMNRGWVRVGHSVVLSAQHTTAAYFSTSQVKDFWKAILFANKSGGIIGSAELELCPPNGGKGGMATLSGETLQRYLKYGRSSNPFVKQ